MNVVLWIVAVLLAVAFLGAGGMKLARSKADLAGSGQGWAEDRSAGEVKAIGAIEVIGAIGLIVPAATGIATVLTPVAALGLGLVMIGAVVVHVRRHEPPVPAVVLAVLALALAVLRFGPYSF